MIKNWKKNKFIVIIFIIVVFLFPSTLSRVSDYNSMLICLGIGVDVSDDGYTFSVQSLVPEQTSAFKKNLKTHSAKGKTLQQSVNNLATHLGKEIGLAHCAFIVVNQEVLNGNLINVVDFFIRKYKISYNSVVVATEKKSQEILDLGSELNNSEGFNFSSLLDYNNRNIFSRAPNIENIYSSVLGGSPYYAIDIISSSKNADEGVEVSSNSGESSAGEQASGGGSQSSSQNNQSQEGDKQEKDNVLVNNGDVFLMKKGQSIAKVNVNDNVGVRYINPSNKNFSLTVSGINDNIFKDATIDLYSQKKVQFNNYYFEQNVPVVELNIVQYFTITNVKQNDYDSTVYSISENIFSKELIDACEKEIVKNIQSGVDMLKRYNCDVSHVYNAFIKYDYYKFKDFINNLKNKDEYFKYIKFVPKVSVRYYSD